MRATLNWSHDLLSEQEKVLFRCLSVFAGGFTLESAEAVGAADDLGTEDVVLLLGELVDQSLVAIQRGAEGGEVRYVMLEPVRQYAHEKLEASGEAKTLRRSHAMFFLALVERAYPELSGARQVEWLNRLDQEYGNLMAAMSWVACRCALRK